MARKNSSKGIYRPKRGAFYRSLQNQLDSSGQNLNIIKEEPQIIDEPEVIELKAPPNIWTTVA